MPAGPPPRQGRRTPQVEIVDRTDIIAPTFRGSGAAARVTGVLVQTSGEPERHLEADLVVDATGRGSRTPLWLGELDLPGPAEESVRVDLTYTTRAFHMTLADTAGDVAVITVPTPEVSRGGALVVAENGLGLLTLRVEGRRTAALKAINRYLQRLQRAAVRDAALSLAFQRVTNLLAAPPALMRPDRAVRVLARGR
jgi:hypothetical protein